ncbi:CAP domain-containing protein [Rubripirellula lacrimiformis]|nr:CAP domain-containing protein [Rubripirellula lacrimiformis]
MNPATACILCQSLIVVATTVAASGQEPSSTSSDGNNAELHTRSSNMIATVEDAIFTQTNAFRKSNDLGGVQRDDHLMQAAEKFAEFMARTDKYGHRANGQSPAQRAEAAGYDYCVVRENIAYRSNTGEITAETLIEVFVQGWIDSPPHRENMLADYATETGVGVATTDEITYYAVQMFGRPKSAAFQLTLINKSEETKTVVFRANDEQDEVELQPQMTLRMTRCLPTKISLPGSGVSKRMTSRATLTITDEGITESD